MRDVARELGALPQLEAVAPLLGLDHAMPVEKEESHEFFDGPCKLVDLPGRKFVTFDCKTGRVIQYFYGRNKDVPSDIAQRRLLTKEEAVEKAKALLAALGIKDNLEPPRFGPTPTILHAWGEAPAWRLAMGYVQNGASCGSISVSICAVFGTIVEYMDSRRMLPKDLKAKLTKEEAIEAALRFAKERGLGLSRERIKWQKLIYSPGNNHWDPDAKGPAQYEPQPRLMWDICFSPDDPDDDFGTIILIDAITGEIAGG